MIVSCEECGKRYFIDENEIKGGAAKFNCHTCNHINIVTKPNPVKKPEPEGFSEPGPPPEPQYGKRTETNMDAVQTSKIQGIGIRGKMMILFILVPVLLMLGASAFYLNQMRDLSNLITGDSSKMVTQMAEQIILEKGLAVAREVKLYLDTHPELRKEQFNTNPEFKKIAMQKVGETGYTLLVERMTEERPVEYIWVHPAAKLVGVDVEDAMKKRLGEKWARWNKVRSKDHITQGYYLWFDNREKFCAGIPVPGTPFNVVSSTYIDEFKKPVEDLQSRAEGMTNNTMYSVIFIFAIATLLVAAITFLYGNSLSGKIRNLTDVADRISIGELEAEIKVKSNDEIGALADAINRMQDSIRISLDRLHRRGR